MVLVYMIKKEGFYMKKWVRSIVFMFALVLSIGATKNTVFADIVEVNEKNFPDENIRSALMWDAECDEDGHYHINTDYVISLSANAVKNTKGIELLKNLKYLYLYEFASKKIDVTSVSTIENLFVYSDKLENVNVSGLKKLSIISVQSQKLKVVNVKNCSALENFSVYSKSCKIDLADLYKKNLKYFYVESSDIKSVKLDKFKNLEGLSLGNTNVKSLDLSKNKKLQYVSLYNNAKLATAKWPTSNKLTNIYIVGSRKLKTFNAKLFKNLNWLSIIDCSLSKIDLSKCTKLESLELNGNKKLAAVNISKNKKLGRVNVGATAVKKLDTSKNPELYRLSVYDTKISSLNLKKNTSLSSLNYYNSKIKKLDLSKQGNMDLEFFDVKKGATIDLSNIVGKNCKLISCYNLKYKNGKITTSKSTKENWANCELQKGDKLYYIYISFKSKNK